jgi:hypothetical protein
VEVGWADVNETFHGDDQIHCIECKQPVRRGRASNNGVAAHFETPAAESEMFPQLPAQWRAFWMTRLVE